MKCLVITIALLSAINLATCSLRSSNSYDSGATYLQYLRERNQEERFRSQFQSFCPDKTDELDEALIQLKECTDKIDEDTETLCSATKNHFLKCSKPIVQVLESCFPEESKEVPNLVFHSMNSAIGYLCKTDGEHIFELANSCVFKSSYRSMRCERRIRTKLQQYKNKPPTKNDICEMAVSMKPCLHNHLQDSCGNQITREAFSSLFDALTTPCKTINNQLEFNNVNEVELF